MDFKTVERLKIAYDRIKELDAEIMEIDKLGMLIAEKNVKTALTFSVTDLDAESKEKVKFDEDGSIVRGGGLSDYLSMFSWMEPTSIVKAEKASERVIKAELSPTTALRVLGELVACKRAERERYLSYLERQGVRV